MAKSSLQVSGSLHGLVLAVLEEAPLHGYGIAREIEKRSSDALSFGEGALYPALKALERDEFIVGKWDSFSAGGPARKVYEITQKGHTELARIRVNWLEYSRSIDSVLKGKAGIQPA